MILMVKKIRSMTNVEQLTVCMIAQTTCNMHINNLYICFTSIALNSTNTCDNINIIICKQHTYICSLQSQHAYIIMLDGVKQCKFMNNTTCLYHTCTLLMLMMHMKLQSSAVQWVLAILQTAVQRYAIYMHALNWLIYAPYSSGCASAYAAAVYVHAN